ncbi:type I-E CRISPR-associated protein Cas5/CasD [Propionibacteriaceae bacterium G57]|uniref:type I-E CRISPR-associated protein Cas5/CasD n=1 Tax=Aestuariimicrobium sp. G57 TaxID=3418485 RepID=UPI003DA79538
MTALLLRLAGPLQSWGDSSRFLRRDTNRYPTKSGVLGLLAAAMGVRRTDPIEELLRLRFGVRTDQPGVVITDFQTAHTSGPKKPPTVTHRRYLADAVFVAGVQGDDALIEGLRSALERPAFPLFLGRRSCPVEGKLVLGVTEEDLPTALAEVPWQASDHHRRRERQSVPLPLVIDAAPDEVATAQTHDSPVSYDPRNRQHTWRPVVETTVSVDNPAGRSTEGGLVDWLVGLERA